jgi:hypothetical protein
MVLSPRKQKCGSLTDIYTNLKKTKNIMAGKAHKQ